MSTERYGNNADRSMQQPCGGQGLAITRRCDEPRCARPMRQGHRRGGLYYCAACFERKRAAALLRRQEAEA